MALAGAAVTFLVSYRFVLHHFLTGPYLWDSGWLSYAIYRNGFLLPNPPYLRHAIGGSLFTQHLYALVSLASPLSYLAGTHYHYFASVVGATYALTFVAPFLAVLASRPRPERSVVLAFVACAAGLAFAFSGPVMSAMGYPHFEVAMPCFFVMFVALHFLGWARAKWVALLLGALVREDGGAHYCLFLTAIALYQRWSSREAIPQRTLIKAAVLSATVSAAMLVVQRELFPLGASMFYKSFIGDPPLAHLEPARIATRVRTFLDQAKPIYAPSVIIVALGLILRAPAFAIASVACVPWIVLNVLFSLTPAATTLSLYYGFPLLLGLAWPLLAMHWIEPSRRSLTQSLAVFFVAALSSCLFFEHYGPMRADIVAGGQLSPDAYARERRCLESEFQGQSSLYADTSIVAMFPHSVPAGRVLNGGAEIAAAPADALIYYENEMADAYQDRAQVLGLSHSVVIAHPRIVFVSRDVSAFKACLGDVR